MQKLQATFPPRQFLLDAEILRFRQRIVPCLSYSSVEMLIIKLCGGRSMRLLCSPTRQRYGMPIASQASAARILPHLEQGCHVPMSWLAA
jgi:hypothetical protein